MQHEFCRDTGQDLTKKEKEMSQEYQKQANKDDQEVDEGNETDYPPRSPQSIFFDLIGRVLVRTDTLWLYRTKEEWKKEGVIRKPHTKEDVINGGLFSNKPLLIEFRDFNRYWLLTGKEFLKSSNDFELIDDSSLLLHIADHNKSTIKFLLPKDRLSKSVAQGFDFLAHEVALKDGKKPGTKHLVDFSELAECAEGAKFLGVLRMDVDDLGFLFAYGLPNREKTIVQVANLSRMLDMFFTGYLNVLVSKNNSPKPSLYTSYAGGDDLFIAGAWDKVVELAEDINDAFKSYCGQNPDLHISAGIALCKGKYPIGRAAEDAGEVLNTIAKADRKDALGAIARKNSLAFLGQQIPWVAQTPWGDWPEVKRLTKLLVDGIRSEDVSRGFIYSLLSLERRYIEKLPCQEPKIQVHLLVPKFLYSLVRNVKDSNKDSNKKMIIELKDLILSKNLPYLSVIAGYAAMKTRSQDKLNSLTKD